MRPVAVLDMDTRSPEAEFGPHLADRLVRVDCYDLGDAAPLAEYAGLVVPPMVDQEHLAARAAAVRRYLDRGGVVVFGGQLHRPWLPGAVPFVALEVRSHHDYEVAWIAEHPVFAGVAPDDLTYRRGVAGFFARGHHPVPAGADVLVRLVGGQPVTYVDRVSTGGTILVQASSHLLSYDNDETPDGRIAGQLLDWITTEAASRSPR